MDSVPISKVSETGKKGLKLIGSCVITADSEPFAYLIIPETDFIKDSALHLIELSNSQIQRT